MITDYQPPATTLTPIFVATSTPVSNLRVACAVGPNYRLHRFDEEFDFDDASVTSLFDADGLDLSFKYLNGSIATAKPVAETVDANYVKVFANKLEAEFAHFLAVDSPGVTVVSASQSNVLKASSTYVFSGAGTKPTALRGRPVKVGDVAVVTGAALTYKRKVVGFRGKDVAASFGTNTTADDGIPAGATTNPQTTIAAAVVSSVPDGSSTGDVVVTGAGFRGTLAGAYRDGRYEEVFTLTCSSGGELGGTMPTVTVTSASGLYSGTITATEVTSTFQFSSNTILAGLVIAFDPANSSTTNEMVSGDTIVVTYTGAYTRVTTSDGAGAGIFRPGASDAYTGARDTTFVIEVITGTYTASPGDPSATGAVIRVTDTAGLYGTHDYTLTDAAEQPLSTSGLSVVFEAGNAAATPQRGLRKGDRYTVTAKAATESTTDFDKVVLDGPAVDISVFTNFATKVDVSFRQEFTGQILATDAEDGSAWSVEAENVEVSPALSLYMADRNASYKWCPFVTDTGYLTTEWRSLIPRGVSESVTTVTSDSEIAATFGVIDADNDLAYAASLILQGGSGTALVLRTSGTNAAAYTSALGKIERKQVEYVVATTDDADVRTAVRSHVVNASSSTNQMYREAWLGTSSPGKRVVLDEVSGSQLTATITAYSGQNILVTLTNAGATIAPYALTAGDLIEVEGVEYEYASAISTNEFLLASGPATPISPAVAAIIKKADTPANNVEAISAAAVAMSTEYVRLVWSEGMLTAAGDPIEPRFVAAYLAGLRTATRTQQGLTNTALPVVASAIPTFTRYTDTQLNTLASNGVFIVSQLAEGSPVVVRHALTTRTDNGALSYEEMVVTNALRITRQLRAVNEPYKGRRNVNESTINEIVDKWIGVLSSETRAPSDATGDIGPALIGFDSPIATTHPTLRDRIVISATCQHPLPANHIEGSVYFEQADVLQIQTSADAETVA